MKLSELLKPWIDSQQLPECEISGLHNDSRQIKPGFLFLAYPGQAADGRLFISQAIEAGAGALIYEPENWPSDLHLPTNLPCIPLKEIPTKLAAIASRFYDKPAEKLAVTGVTGTNGKTTIAYQLAQAHHLLAQPAAYIGTLGQGDFAALQPLMNTTPDALCLQTLMYHYLQKNIKHVCMEVSSHALCQQRVANIAFQQAIFTNLSHEHLDYHQNMDAYAAAKAMLFAWPTLEYAIINQDDGYSELMQKGSKAKHLISYGLSENATVRGLDWQISLQGTELALDSPWGNHELSINTLGFFNIYNALAIFTSLLASGYAATDVVAIMAKLKAAPGRMEIVTKSPYTIVDYAHSPDALENVLMTLHKVKKGRIIVVFGCGGDRDKTKRPLMGKIANQYADIIIITSDNPRSEDPLAIINEVAAGIATKTTSYKIVEREQAIIKAITVANKDDIILVAGKGHEEYQQIGKQRYPFSDKAVIKRFNKI